MNKRIVLPGCWPVILGWSTWYWKRNGTSHGPQSNPKLLALNLVKLGADSITFSGHRLWFYVRGGYALMFEMYVDRRVRS